MKTKIEKSKIILITIILSMIISGVYAQSYQNTPTPAGPTDREVFPEPPPPPPPPAPPQMPGEFDGPKRVTLGLPDLTPLQRDKIRKIDLKNLETITPFRNQVREKKAKLASLISDSLINYKETDLLVDELAKIQASIMKQLIRHDQDLRSVLTSDQQIIFDSRPKPFLENKKDRKKKDF